MAKLLSFILLSLIFVGCKDKKSSLPATLSDNTEQKSKPVVEDNQLLSAENQAYLALEKLSDTSFIRLEDYSDDFVYEMKYATEDNFLKQQVYDCDECYVRVATAKALIEVNKVLQTQGYRIKFFDCYRPHDVQKKMWKIMPNPVYVADPAKGSIHNKGGAVDITLVDASGKELDMGTPFDYFGKKAHHAFTNLPDTVLQNRTLLKNAMEAFGFNAITSEWWHYNYGPTLEYDIANFTWNCE